MQRRENLFIGEIAARGKKTNTSEHTSAIEASCFKMG
jgi:hypothetical protein